MSENPPLGGAIPRFLVDGTAGKLARWLRILGFDATYVSACSESELVKRARQSGRIALTRNGNVAARLGDSALLIESESLLEQLGQVVEFAGGDACHPFSRCSICNIGLKKVDRASVEGRVPEYVYETQEAFSTCPECGRYYWHGTHWSKMLERVRHLVEGECDEGE